MAVTFRSSIPTRLGLAADNRYAAPWPDGAYSLEQGERFVNLDNSRSAENVADKTGYRQIAD
jgi:hypothetical protein